MILAWVWGWQALAAVGCGIAIVPASVTWVIANRVRRRGLHLIANMPEALAWLRSEERSRSLDAEGIEKEKNISAISAKIFSATVLAIAVPAAAVFSLGAALQSSPSDGTGSPSGERWAVMWNADA